MSPNRPVCNRRILTAMRAFACGSFSFRNHRLKPAGGLDDLKLDHVRSYVSYKIQQAMSREGGLSENPSLLPGWTRSPAVESFTPTKSIATRPSKTMTHIQQKPDRNLAWTRQRPSKGPAECQQGSSINQASARKDVDTNLAEAYFLPRSLAMRSEYSTSTSPASFARSMTGASFHSASRR